jgi:hypothetical protein
MLAVTWWGWAGAGTGVTLALAAACLVAGLRSRRRWRQALVDHLRRTAPDIEIAAIHHDRLELRFPGRGPDARGTFHLERFYDLMTALAYGHGAAAPDQRSAVYDTIAAAIRDGATGLDGLDAAAERVNVMPRIVNDATLAALRGHVAGSGKDLPSLPSGVAGLSIVFVLDREAAVAYLTGDLLADLELTPDQALEVGRANLARDFGRDVVRAAVGSPNLNVIKTCDSFDAARLLLVPGYLEAGERLVALIPDRDTLVLTTPPADDDWAGLRTLAVTADGDPLYPEPLVVTSAGIARAA